MQQRYIPPSCPLGGVYIHAEVTLETTELRDEKKSDKFRDVDATDLLLFEGEPSLKQ
jgi:hypothetical protein